MNLTFTGGLECTVQEGFAGTYVPRVVLGDMGLAAVNPAVTVRSLLKAANFGWKTGQNLGQIIR